LTTIRRAVISDVPRIHALVNEYAREQLMLPRPLGELYENNRDFFVALDDEGDVAGCGALHVVWGDLAEIKCLAVAKTHQKEGLGTALVRALVAEAKELGLPKVFCLTYQGEFFKGLGFRHVPKDTLPHKIWGECIRCPQFPDCDEEAYEIEPR